MPPAAFGQVSDEEWLCLQEILIFRTSGGKGRLHFIGPLFSHGNATLPKTPPVPTSLMQLQLIA